MYRYVLWREWAKYVGDMRNPPFDDELKPVGHSDWRPSPYAMVIGLNPSTADESKDDPTIRKCVAFAKLWNCGALCMVNLFAFRATKPRDMMHQPRPVGNENDMWLVRCAREARVVVAAWGTHGDFMGRDEDVCKLLDGLLCLGVTRDGFPRHPLYVPYCTSLMDYDYETNRAANPAVDRRSEAAER